MNNQSAIMNEEFNFLEHDFICGDKLLIEASAGTGKTFNIENIVLKLITEGLKSNQQSDADHKIEVIVSEILIVTFTELATAELCARIRENIQEALHFVENIEKNFAIASESYEKQQQTPLENFILQFVELGYGNKHENFSDYNEEKRQVLIQRLNHALYTFDEASICTIHSFCQRMLQEFSIDSNQLFNNELVDSKQLIEKIVYKFIREHFYNSESNVLNIISLMNKFDFEYFSEIATTLDRYGNIDIHKNYSCDEYLAMLIQQQKQLFSNVELLKNEILLFQDNNFAEVFFNNADFCVTDFKKNYSEQFNNNLQNFITAIKNNDHFLILELATFFAVDNLESNLKVAKKKCWQPSNNSANIFKNCQNINENISKISDLIQEYFAIYFKQEYDNLIAEQPIVTYNELLLKLHRALNENPRLVDNIRQKYKVALIDEFQDTDKVQFQIFDKIFGCNNNTLIMVGDPKQAIYSFRGADIFTYLDVAENLSNEQKATLVKNYRTSQNLLNAINCLFAKEMPFAIDNINFINAVAGKETDDIFIDNENILQQPLKIIQPDNSEEFNFSTNSYRKYSVAVTAKKIAEILNLAETNNPHNNLPNARIKNRKIIPGDIAVLVRSGFEGDLIHQELAKYNINSVKQSNENIFSTQDAIDLLKLIEAVLNPQNSKVVMTALALPYFNFNFKDIYQLNYDEEYATQYEAIVEILIFYRNIWQRSSFIKMINIMVSLDIESILDRQFITSLNKNSSLLTKLNSYNIKTNLLKSENGNRKLTNFNHLIELLHQEEKTHKLQPIGLINHLKKCLDNPDNNSEYELRLESDSQAVQILTIHKSKGLQFPIVFCPFVWKYVFNNRTMSKMKSIVYHDRNNEQKLSLTSEQLVEAKHHYRLELLADELRLLYVALTRAKYGCYLIWVDKSIAKGRGLQCNSPMDYLFYNINKHKIDDYLQTPTYKNLQKCLVNKNTTEDNPEEIEINQQKLWLNHPNIEFVKVSQNSLNSRQDQQRYRLNSDDANKLKNNLKISEFNGKIAKDFRVLSFSNLNSNMPHSSEIIEEVNDDDKNNQNEQINSDYLGENEVEEIINSESILGDFPRGIFSGDCIHDLFEHLDFNHFQKQNTTDINIENDFRVKSLTEALLKKYGRLKFNINTQQESYQRELTLRQEQLVKMFKNTVSSELFMGANRQNHIAQEGIVLEKLNPQASVCEMPFFFKIENRFIADELLKFSNQAFNVKTHHNFNSELISENNSRREQLYGFMNGKIDLFFEHQGKFYIADWKSSFLGEFNNDYGVSAIEKDMRHKNYYLQAAIYTIAVKNYLENKLTDFDYERDFGGVFYLYIRGINNDLKSGVWSMKPDLYNINLLSELLNG